MAEKIKYGKIDSLGKLEYAPSILKPAGGGFIINPSAASLVAEGYVPIIEEIPEHEEGERIEILRYEYAQDGKSIIITYQILEDSGVEASSELVFELREEIAVLNSQVNSLAAANENLSRTIEDNASSLEEYKIYQSMYYEANTKAEALEDEISDMESDIAAFETLLEERNFYANASAAKSYADYKTTLDEKVSIIKNGSSEVIGTINSTFEFIPLKIYSATYNGETRWLVYTPPGKTLKVGPGYYPIAEAYGGDWVALNVDLEDSYDDDIDVMCWVAMDGTAHVGLYQEMPDEVVSSFKIATFPYIEDSDSQAEVED